MAQTLKGKAVVWGVAGITATGVVISATTGATQSADITRDSDVWQLTDGNGEVIGEAFYNEKVVLAIDVIPFSATDITTAITNADNLMPAPGTAVVVTDSQSGITDGTAVTKEGHYTLLSATQKRTNNGAAVISMQLRAYTANDVTATKT